MLSQAWYWSSRTNDQEGWFYKTRSEWTEETGMSRSEQETARRRLVKLELLEEKLAGMPGKLHFRVNTEQLILLLVEKPPTREQKAYQQLGGHSTNNLAQNPPAITTESTEETTTESISRRDCSTSPAQTLFSIWQTEMNHPKAIFDEKRKRAVNGRLKDGFTIERLHRAILGNKSSDYHQAQHPKNQKHVYDDLELICRDAKHVEQFEKLYVAAYGSVYPPPEVVEEFSAPTTLCNPDVFALVHDHCEKGTDPETVFGLVAAKFGSEYRESAARLVRLYGEAKQAMAA
jgi:hypothetical protein